MVRGRTKVHDAIAKPILAQQYQGLDRGNSQPSRPDVHRKSLRQEIIKRSSNIQLLIFFAHMARRDARPTNDSEFTLFSALAGDRKSTRLNSSHTVISYAGFCVKKKKTK